MHILCPAVAAFLLQRAADEIKPGFIEVCTELVRSRHPDHDGHGLGDQLEPLFTFSESKLFLLDRFSRVNLGTHADLETWCSVTKHTSVQEFSAIVWRSDPLQNLHPGQPDR